MPNNNFNNPNKLDYTEAQIRNGFVRERGHWWDCRCPNSTAHKHGDRKPSFTYDQESGFGQCFGCGIKGFALDRNRPDWERRQIRTYSNGTQVHRTFEEGQKKIFQLYPSKSAPKPYGYQNLHSNIRTIFIVEGEKCADRLTEELDPRTEISITSLQGANSPQKTDWKPVIDKLKTGKCSVIFVPDRDDAGEKYIRDVAQLLGLFKYYAIYLGGDKPESGYDVYDWLEENNPWSEHPAPEELQLPSASRQSGANHGNQPETKKEFRRSSWRERNPKPSDVEIEKQLDEDYGKSALHTEWLIENVIQKGEINMVFAPGGAGKTNVTRDICAHILQGRNELGVTPAEDEKKVDCRTRVLWWSNETKSNFLRKGFEISGVEWSNDEEHKPVTIWGEEYGKRLAETTDTIEIDSETEEVLACVESSPYTQMMERLTAAKNSGQPYEVVVLDPISAVLGDANKAHVVDRLFDERIEPIIELGATVIGIAHPRKDSPRDASTVNSLSGSQRLTSRPRIVAYVVSEEKKKLMHVPGGDADSAKHVKPLADRVKTTPNPDADTRCGAIIVCKANDFSSEQNRAFHFHFGGEENLPPKVKWSSKPWMPSDFLGQPGVFVDQVAQQYRVAKPPALSEGEKLARDTRIDNREATEVYKKVISPLFEKQDLVKGSEIAEALENAGLNPDSRAARRAKLALGKWDPKRHGWVPKGKK